MPAVDTSQWAVAFFPKNKEKNYYTIRLFKTPEIATAYYAKSARTTQVFMSAGEMSNRLSVPKLKEYLIDVTRQFSDLQEQYKNSELSKNHKLLLEEDSVNELIQLGNRDAFAKGLWTLCHIVGDQVFGLPDGKENEDKFKICLDRLTSDEGRAIWGKFTKQAQVLCQGLIDLAEPVVEESELHQMVRNLVKQGKLKTKQDPVLIWKYYASTLGDNSLIFYPGKRWKLENHNEEMNSI